MGNENLCKNAIDAMNGNGFIDIFVQKNQTNILLTLRIQEKN
jgi:hypothetical protein